MKGKIFLYLSLPVICLFTVYSLLWFASYFFIYEKLNKLAGVPLGFEISQNKAVIISFGKPSVSGYPFKLRVKISGLTYETSRSSDELVSPVKIEYSLTGLLKLSYSGEIYSRGKNEAVSLRASVEDYSLSFSMPAAGFFKILYEKPNPFALVNLLKGIDISSGRCEIFDRGSGKKVFDRDYEKIGIKIESSRYYDSFEELSKNPPEALISYSASVNSSMEGLFPDFFNIFRGVAWPLPLKTENLIYVRSFSSQKNEGKRKVEIGAKFSSFSSPKFSFKGAFDYASLSGKDGEISSELNARYSFDVKKNFFGSSIDNLSLLVGESKNLEKDPIKLSLLGKLENFLSGLTGKSLFEGLEDKKYNLNLDSYLNYGKWGVNFGLRAFSLFSGANGLYFKSAAELSPRGVFSAKGVLGLNGYEGILDPALKDFLGTGRYKDFSEKEKYLYGKILKVFLKKISDHPKSSSKDLSFEYNLSSAKLSSGKIGSAEVKSLASIYESVLYSEVLGFRKNTGDKKSITDLIKKLHPSFVDERKEWIEKYLKSLNETEK